MALGVFFSLSESVVLLFNVRKKKDITAGKTMALEREDVFKMSTNKHLLETRSLSCSVFGGHF